MNNSINVSNYGVKLSQVAFKGGKEKLVTNAVEKVAKRITANVPTATLKAMALGGTGITAAIALNTVKSTYHYEDANEKRNYKCDDKGRVLEEVVLDTQDNIKYKNIHNPNTGEYSRYNPDNELIQEGNSRSGVYTKYLDGEVIEEKDKDGIITEYTSGKICCKKQNNKILVRYEYIDDSINMYNSENKLFETINTKTGDYNKYNSLGRLYEFGNTKTGDYTKLDSDGNKEETGNTESGEYTKLKSNGETIETGNTKADTYTKYEDGYVIRKDNTGNITTLKNDIYGTIEKIEYKDGTLEEFIHEQELNNPYGDYYKKTMPDGSIEFYTVNDHKSLGGFDKNGYGTRYYENGEIAEQINEDGTYLYKYENGIIRAEKNEQGEIIMHYENGNLRFKREITGFSSWYNNDGSLKKTLDTNFLEKCYHNDGTIKETQYDRYGNYEYTTKYKVLVYESPCGYRDDVYKTISTKHKACYRNFNKVPDIFD